MPKLLTENERRVHICIRLPLAVVDKIKAARGSLTLTQWLESLIQKALR